MMLIDTGPIVALLNEQDHKNEIAARQLKVLPPSPLITTWPCFVESMYLLGKVGGYRYQCSLWLLHTSKRLLIHSFSAEEIEQMKSLMQQYQDIPMDLADASLMVAAESLNLYQIFTFDTHFYIYRLTNGQILDVLP